MMMMADLEKWRTKWIDRLHEKCPTLLTDPESIAQRCSICGSLVSSSQYHVTSDVITQSERHRPFRRTVTAKITK